MGLNRLTESASGLLSLEINIADIENGRLKSYKFGIIILGGKA